MEAQLRPGRPSDARAVAELVIEAWQAAYRGILPDALLDGLQVEPRMRRWQARLERQPPATLVLERAGQLLGLVWFGPCRDAADAEEAVGELNAVYVAAGHWRRGHGSTLMDGALAALREMGCVEVTLWVLRDNARAIRFYERHGFQADGGRKIERREHGAELHEIRLRRPL
jgi:ribosomal protein S18 acetylase RimI-like enzyme